jgi:hypothetical protein
VSTRSEAQHFIKCDKCGLEVVLETNPVKGWGWLRIAPENDSVGLYEDLCPRCYKWVKEFAESKPVELHFDMTFDMTFDPKKMADAVDKALGYRYKQSGTTDNRKRPDGCTCPDIRMESIPPTSGSGVTYWTFKPCPIHPIQSVL